MARHKYRLCPLCRTPRSYTYGYDAPRLCPCGATLQTITRQEWVDALFAHAARTTEPEQEDTMTTHETLTWTTDRKSGKIIGSIGYRQIASISTTDDGAQRLVVSVPGAWARHTEETVQQAKDRASRLLADWARVGLITAALALAALVPATTHAMEPPTWQQPVYPDLTGCTVSYHVDDGTGLAECPDGTRYYLDRDGQRWVSESGAPLRAPNNWYVLEDAS